MRNKKGGASFRFFQQQQQQQQRYGPLFALASFLLINATHRETRYTLKLIARIFAAELSPRSRERITPKPKRYTIFTRDINMHR